MVDYYEVLEVSPDAPEGEIRRAYRRLARQYHPDLSEDPEAQARFMLINEAYNTLTDPGKRREYDRERQEQEPKKPGSRAEKGSNVVERISVSLEEVARGVEKEIRFSRRVTCSVCGGRGTERGSRRRECPECAGSGQVRRDRFLGCVTTLETCSRCDGQGEIIPQPCPECQGKGQVRRHRATRVQIPPGVDSESRVRVEGEGHQGKHGGPPGDLIIIVDIEPHPRLRRRGPHIESEAKITFTQAALGTEIEVPTLWGPEKLRIPGGTQTHTTFTLGEMGMPTERGRGDHLVKIIVETPTDLTEEQKELLRELDE